MYKSYGLLRPVAIFAGTVGILQSLIWMAMSIIAIIAYYCGLNFRGMEATLGTITELAVFVMYFHGPCSQSGLPNIDYYPIKKLNLIQPTQIHICVWIYLIISLFWLISSITLLTNVRYVNLKYANKYLFLWIILTACVSILDLGLGIAFAVDYETLRHEAHKIVLEEVETAENPQYLYFSAKTAATIMLVICFRGFTIWLINISLCIFFFTQTFKITDYNRIKEAITNPAFISSTSNTLQRNQPIQAYGSSDWFDYSNSGQAAAIFDERRRHYDAQRLHYLRPEDLVYKSNRKSKQNHNGTAYNAKISKSPRQIYPGNVGTAQLTSKKKQYGYVHNEFQVPDPDYSPTLPRVNSFDNRPPLRSALRTTHY